MASTGSWESWEDGVLNDYNRSSRRRLAPIAAICAVSIAAAACQSSSGGSSGGSAGGPSAKKSHSPNTVQVSITPANGATDVSPSTKELRVTFNVAMGDGFSWTGGGPQFPTIPEGKRPSWTDDHKSCVLPVELQPNSQYRLGLNSQSFHGFQSADGVPLAPVVYTFKTSGQ